MASEGIKVAVRTRPFNAREQGLNAKVCLTMDGTMTKIKDVDDSQEEKKFTFDYSFWSHDGFHDEDGYSEPDQPNTKNYADQKYVYSVLGESVLNNAWGGFHCCLFAYGQTGAGKSYSMIGYGKNRGIVPLSCSEIFRRIKENTDPEKQYEVAIQMSEIYMEKVQDLFLPAEKRNKEGLKVRESKTLGVYVEGLSKKLVSSYEEIKAAMDLGEKNRSIGGTLMNATSSRAHTVIGIEFKNITIMGAKKSTKQSVINLIDLAGSEKAEQTGATGDRLQEGCAINKSLSCLGNVISALADKAMGKGKGQVVPFRDSKLTQMLKNALGGNSKTIMICALSPASSNYEETLSTLRYADRAKKIKNKAVINESPQDKLIRELKEENDKLKKALAAGGGSLGDGAGGDPEADEKLKDMQAQMEENARRMAEMEQSYEDRLKASQGADKDEMDKLKAEQAAKESTKPILFNLNSDQMLDRKIFQDLSNPGAKRVGRKNASEAQDIVLGGVGIEAEHAKFVTGDDGNVTLVPCNEKAMGNIIINGVTVTSLAGQVLKPNDRIFFGTSSAFIFKHKDKEAEAEKEDTDSNPISFEMADKERIDIQDAAEAKRREEEKLRMEEETKKRMEEMNAKLEAEKRQQEEERQKMQAEFEAKLKALEASKADGDEEAARKQKEMEERIRKEMLESAEMQEIERKKQEAERKRQLEEEEERQRKRQQEYNDLEKKLGIILPMVNEANMISQELKRKIVFNTKMVKQMPDFLDEGGKLTDGITDVVIKIDNDEEKYSYEWTTDKFQNRLYIMRELLDEFFESNEIPKKSKEEDPFWDPTEPQLIGQSYLQLKNLSYVLDNVADIAVLSTDGTDGNRGKLSVSYIPCDETGEDEPDDSLLVEEPEELMGKDVCFKVCIDKCSGLPRDLCKNVFVSYAFKHEGGIRHKTEVCDGQDPTFNFSKLHRLDDIDNSTLRYLENGSISFKVYGNSGFAKNQVIAKVQEKPKINQQDAEEQQEQLKQEKTQIMQKQETNASQGGALQRQRTKQADKVQELQQSQVQMEQSKATTLQQTSGVTVVETQQKSGCCTIF